jgi:ABC-type nitrate/sulfonate/bicarbonate transport system substrate-binding protein
VQRRKWTCIVFLTILTLIYPVGIASTIVRGDEAKKVVRIGYQKSGAFLLVRNEGTLEKRLEPLGYEVQWKEFPSGPPLLEALNGGSLDFGHSGDAPLVFAQSAGVPFQYIGSTSPAEESAGILVPKSSPLKQVSELKGKRVAFAKGSSSHYLLAKALILDVLRETGDKAILDPKGTAAFLASKLGIDVQVLEKSELRKQRYYAEPMNAQSIAGQQEVADTFSKLGLIPQPVRIADDVFKPNL